MKPRRNANPSAQNSKSFQGEGTNWILIAGGALLSTLSIRLGYKLKQYIDTRRLDNASNSLKGNRKLSEKRRSGACAPHSNIYSFTEDEDACYSCLSEGMVEVKKPPVLKEREPSLPLVAIPSPGGVKRENSVMWTSSPDRLEMPRKPFQQQSNSSDSPCVSECGSDIFSKREVIHKLRQQLKRRDEMVAEMQDQIMELQSSLGAQLTHSQVLQSQVDAANSDLFELEREIQRLRKAIADHCVRGGGGSEKRWSGGEMGDDKLEMLKRQVGELKEVIEGKDYLLKSYKEQKAELCSKVTDLQHRLVSQIPPNIL